LGARAQTPRDFAIDLRAAVSDTSPHITLSWSLRQGGKISAQKIYRRLKTAADDAWELLETLATDDTSYADHSAQPGVEYEYWLQRTFSGLSPSPAVGYLSAGVGVPMAEHRGTLLLVVDDTMAAPLAPEIAQLQTDLAGDGWTVQTLTAPRAGTASGVKAQIKAAYDADPANVKMVYLLGHVPVPYSGSIAPDGHGDHSGAWPADAYYGDMDGVWTDTTVNNTSASRTQNDNVPGDGKFDQSMLPSSVELMVGRVDLHSMTKAPTSAATETMLLRRYLRKTHDYRHKQGAYAAIPRRSVLRDGFGYFSGEAFAIAGWSWMFSSVGLTVDEAPSGQWFSASYAGGKDYLVGYGNGGGSYESASTVGTSTDFGLKPSRAVFTSLFGSYFGDWDANNDLLRAPLAGNATGDSLGLTCFWGGRPNRFMHHLGMGETVGFATLISHNNYFSLANNRYQPANSYLGYVHPGLMGDPALRLHAVAPPRDLAGASAGGQISLSWTAPAETAVQGYHVYRAATPAGPFTRLTEDPLSGTSFADAAVTPGQSYTYLVRTLKLESSPGGSYFNLSVGSPLTLTATAAPSAVPRNPASPAVAQTGAAHAQLTWTDTSSDETGFRIERKTNAGGTFALLGTAAANATAFTDPGPFSHGNVYYYRLLATNAAGASAPSPEVSFDAVAGHFDMPVTRTKVSKAAGNVTLAVNRFGGLTGAVSVNYATGDTSASAGTHYTAASGKLDWTDGATGERTITVPVINTATPQPARQFRVTLSGNSAGTGVTANNRVAVLIEDPTASLAAPWSQAIVGSVTDSSPAVLIDGVFGSTLIGGSGVTSGTSDNGRFIYQSRAGDGILTAYVPAGLPSDTGARVCLMIRASTANNAVMAAAVSSANSSVGAKLGYRASAGGSAAALPSASNGILQPCWLRLTRAGNLFTAEVSKDNVAWTPLGTATLAGMPATALWGIFHYATNGSDYHLASAQSLTFDNLPLPSAPTGLTATATSPSSITLSWPVVPGAAGYRIERLTETDGFTLLADVAAATGSFQTYLDTGLPPDAAFAYRVTAYNTSGAGGTSETVYVTTPPPYLTVAVTTADPGGADATLQRDLADTPLGTAPVITVAGYHYNDGIVWDAVLTNAAKSYLRFNLAEVGVPVSARLNLTFDGARRFEETGYFDLRASLLADASDGWDESTVTWANAPQNDTNSSGFTGRPPELGDLDVYELPAPGDTVSLPLAVSTLTNNIGANGLVTLALYQHYGASTDWASREHPTLAPPALELSCVNPAPPRPSFLTAAPGSVFSVRLGWRDHASDETAYELERSADGGGFLPLQTLPANTTNFTDAATLPRTVYAYRIRAVNAAGASAWSAVAAIETPGEFSAWGTVWDGGWNNSFSVPQNWELDTLPPFDGSAYLNFAAAGSYAIVNNAASVRGLSLHSANDFTLAEGNGTLILGAGGLRAANPLSTTSLVYTVTTDITLAADQRWGVTNNGAGGTSLVVSGPVTDGDASYGITKAGDGLLVLQGNNSYDGPTLVADGTLCVRHGHALGTAAGPTAVQPGATLDVGGGVLVPEPLSLANGAALLASDGTTNIWAGPAALAGGAFLRASGASSLTLTGGVSAAGNLTLEAETNATLAVSCLPFAAASRTLTATGGGTVAFGAPGSAWAELRIGSTTVRTDAPDAFPPGSVLSLGMSGALDATVDLNGHDQTVARLVRGLVNAKDCLITSAGPATLTVNQTSGSYYYNGGFGGAVSLVKTGAGTLILNGTNNTSTGAFTVSNGTLRVYNAAPTIADAAPLRISSPGKLQLASGFTETVGELVLDGGRKWAGTWGASGSGAENIDNVHFTGTGKVLVPSGTSSAWDGGAATADIDAPFNWDYDDLPALFDGSRTLAFGVGGALATVNTNVHFRGLILNRAADFTIAPGGGAVTLGPDALFAANPDLAAPHTYTVAAPLVMTGPQTWCVTNAGASTTAVVVSGPVSDGGANHTLSKSGDGLLTLAGDNAAFGGGITVLSNSVLRVAHARGLGATTAPTIVQAGGRLETGGGVTVAEPVTLNGDAPGAPGALYAVAGTNTWTGPITQAASSRIGATAGGTLVLAAPVLNGDVTLSPDADACVLIAGQPLLLGSRKLIAHGPGTVAFGVAGSTFNATLEIGGGATVRLDAPNVLPASTILSMGRSAALDATVDLNGHDQTVAQLKRGLITSGKRLITSATPATLTVNYTGGTTINYDGGFGDAVSLVKTGSGSLVLLGTNTTTTGTVTVNGGTLQVNAGATLGTGPRVTVNAGILFLRHGACLSDDAELAIAAGNAKVQLDSGVTETVRTLKIGGVPMRRGTYGAAGSGAAFIDGTRFSGTGVLRVLRGTESVLTIR
jgi:autotransporter-associated beta strand protein